MNSLLPKCDYTKQMCVYHKANKRSIYLSIFFILGHALFMLDLNFTYNFLALFLDVFLFLRMKGTHGIINK